MLATPWRAPFSDPDWRFEPKWDGYRLVLTFDGSSVVLRSRRGNDVTARYPAVAGVGLPEPMALDGEVVAFDEHGRPSFGALQAGAEASYVVFDILHLGDEPVIDRSYDDRIAMLGSLDLAAPLVRSPIVAGDGLTLWQTIVERDLEGMVAKRADSIYRPGVRSPDWRKVHHVNTARVVVGGFTRGEGGRAATFGSLLVGQWLDDRLRFCGAVGTGFSDETLRLIRASLAEQVSDESPFHPDSDLPAGATWVEPRLVAAVGYRDWTSAGRMRHPRFVGFTDDPAESITSAAEGPGSNGP